MTDEEMKRLEDLAKGSPGAFHALVEAREVIALIERVRKAEARAERGGEAKLQPALDIIREPLLEMGCTFPGGGFVGIAEGIREVVAKAERRGAEGMREKAKALAAKEEQTALAQSQKESAGKYGRFDYWDGRRAQCRTLIKWIGDLPLPSDAP